MVRLLYAISIALCLSFATGGIKAQAPPPLILNTVCSQQVYHNGYFYGFGNNQQVYKFDTVGNIVWNKRIGGSPFTIPFTFDIIYRMVVVNEGGIDYLLCLGYTNTYSFPFPGGASESYAMKVDLNGNLVWFRTYRGINVMGMVVDADSNYVLSIKDGFGPLMKVNKNTGLPIWTKENSYFIGGLNAISNEEIYRAGNNFYVTGRVAPVGPVIFMLMKTDSVGTAQWVKAYGDSIPNACWGSYQCHDGGYVMVGNSAPAAVSYNDFLVIRTDANGDTLWCRRYDNDGWTEVGNDIIETSDRGFVISGQSGPTSGSTNDAVSMLFKIDSLGNLLWVKSYNPTSGFKWGLQELANGGFSFTSSFKTFVTDSLGNNCISRDDTLTMGYPQINITNVTVTSQAGVSTNVNPAVQITSIPFTITDYCETLGTEEMLQAKNEITLAPNPATNRLTVGSSSKIKNVTVYNLTGQVVFVETQSNVNQYSLDVGKLQKGVYVVEVVTEYGSVKKKFCKY